MSYTEIPGFPEDLHITIDHNKLMVSFTCPRCNNTQVCEIDLESISRGFEAECTHPSCKADDERFGFRLTMLPQWSQWVLSVFDRPLHT